MLKVLGGRALNMKVYYLGISQCNAALQHLFARGFGHSSAETQAGHVYFKSFYCSNLSCQISQFKTCETGINRLEMGCLDIRLDPSTAPELVRLLPCETLPMAARFHEGGRPFKLEATRNSRELTTFKCLDFRISKMIKEYQGCVGIEKPLTKLNAARQTSNCKMEDYTYILSAVNILKWDMILLYHLLYHYDCSKVDIESSCSWTRQCLKVLNVFAIGKLLHRVATSLLVSCCWQHSSSRRREHWGLCTPLADSLRDGQSHISYLIICLYIINDVECPVITEHCWTATAKPPSMYDLCHGLQVSPTTNSVILCMAYIGRVG